jgi:hypothetical protein
LAVSQGQRKFGKVNERRMEMIFHYLVPVACIDKMRDSAQFLSHFHQKQKSPRNLPSGNINPELLMEDQG